MGRLACDQHLQKTEVNTPEHCQAGYKYAWNLPGILILGIIRIIPTYHYTSMFDNLLL